MNLLNAFTLLTKTFDSRQILIERYFERGTERSPSIVWESSEALEKVFEEGWLNETQVSPGVPRCKNIDKSSSMRDKREW